jgi:hypothetical protein
VGAFQVAGTEGQALLDGQTEVVGSEIVDLVGTESVDPVAREGSVAKSDDYPARSEEDFQVVGKIVDLVCAEMADLVGSGIVDVVCPEIVGVLGVRMEDRWVGQKAPKSDDQGVGQMEGGRREVWGVRVGNEKLWWAVRKIQPPPPSEGQFDLALRCLIEMAGGLRSAEMADLVGSGIVDQKASESDGQGVGQMEGGRREEVGGVRWAVRRIQPPLPSEGQFDLAVRCLIEMAGGPRSAQT